MWSQDPSNLQIDGRDRAGSFTISFKKDASQWKYPGPRHAEKEEAKERLGAGSRAQSSAGCVFLVH